MSPRQSWVWCNGCPTKLIFARRVGTDRKVPYEHADQPPFSDHAAGAHVIISGTAWVPGDAIEDFRVRFEISEDKARELVSGYPFHRPHRCDLTTTAAAPLTDRIRRAVESRAFRYVGERELQAGLLEAFTLDDLHPQPEVHLRDAGRIDFIVSGDRRVGVEVKIQGSIENVLRQLQRYAPHVDELVLVTTKHNHRFLPDTVGEKPLHVVLMRSGL